MLGSRGTRGAQPGGWVSQAPTWLPSRECHSPLEPQLPVENSPTPRGPHPFLRGSLICRASTLETGPGAGRDPSPVWNLRPGEAEGLGPGRAARPGSADTPGFLPRPICQCLLLPCPGNMKYCSGAAQDRNSRCPTRCHLPPFTPSPPGVVASSGAIRFHAVLNLGGD